MSIYIKEYLTFIVIIGLIKIAVPNNKTEHIIKFTSFAAMLFIIVFPLSENLKIINNKPYKAFFESTDNSKSDYYGAFFKDKLLSNYASGLENQCKNDFYNICKNDGITVYNSNCTYDGEKIMFDAVTDKLPDIEHTESFKTKYPIDKLNIRLVNTYEQK